MSLTYIAVVILTLLGVDNAETVANSLIIVVTALVGLWGRYRVGDLKLTGLRK